MNNKEFIAELAQRTGMKPDEAQSMMNTLLSTMGDSFQEGNSLVLPGFGTFEVKKKMERVMVSPQTGQRLLIPPKLALAFKPIPSWKEKIKKGGTE